MSGYTEKIEDSGELVGPKNHFIQKPFSVNDLAAKIQQFIGSGQRHKVSGVALL